MISTSAFSEAKVKMVRPLEYGAKLSLEEVNERIKEIRNEFEKVKSRYLGFFARFNKKMTKEDKKTLSNCIGVLLPLNLEDSVQEQVSQAKSIEETCHYQIAKLNLEIIGYLSNFKNTGVKKL